MRTPCVTRPARLCRSLALALVAGSALLNGSDAADPRQTARGGRAALPSLATDTLDVLAWVGDRPITRQYLESRLDELAPTARRQYQTPEGRRELLDRLVEEQVWLAAAERAKVGERPDVQQRLDNARTNLLIRTYASEVMEEAPAPSDSAIVAYYEAHKHEAEFQTREAIEASHIQVEKEADASKILRDLRRGEEWSRLVERQSQDGTTKGSGGSLGRIERGGGFGPLGRQTALAESAFAAPVGVPVGPVQSSVGWHVLRVDRKIPPEPVPLESVRQRIQADLSRQLGESYYRTTFEGLKGETNFRWNGAAVDSFLIGRRTAAELFRQAQDAPTSDERIAAYLHVVETYPESEFAPQALFMAGFIYSEEKKDYDSAEAAFRRLLELFPKSELGVSANWMLQNMRSEEIPEFDAERGGLQLPDGEASSETPR